MIINSFNFTSKDYLENQPVPHAIFDGLWEDDLIKNIEEEFKSFSEWDGTKNFYGAQFKKYCGTYANLPAKTKEIIDYCNSKDFIKKIEHLTGIENLLPDQTLVGGGMHSTGQGGFLEMHADFNYHNALKLYRRVNVLIYLNSDWKKEFNGDLILTDKEGKNKVSIEPLNNRTVIFTTDENSIHGHPAKLNLPDNRRRNSIALYYYTTTPPEINFSKENDNTQYTTSPSLISRLKLKIQSTFSR